jgi:hypothetical protein
MRLFIILLLALLVSCNSSFNKPRYKKKSFFTWKRKRVVLLKTGTYNNPTIKRETKREMLRPKTINLDKW